MANRLFLCFQFLLLWSIALPAQPAGSQKWDVNTPPGDWGWEDVTFTTDEGTWMSMAMPGP